MREEELLPQPLIGIPPIHTLRKAGRRIILPLQLIQGHAKQRLQDEGIVKTGIGRANESHFIEVEGGQLPQVEEQWSKERGGGHIPLCPQLHRTADHTQRLRAQAPGQGIIGHYLLGVSRVQRDHFAGIPHTLSTCRHSTHHQERAQHRA